MGHFNDMTGRGDFTTDMAQSGPRSSVDTVPMSKCLKDGWATY